MCCVVVRVVSCVVLFLSCVCVFVCVTYFSSYRSWLVCCCSCRVVCGVVLVVYLYVWPVSLLTEADSCVVVLVVCCVVLFLSCVCVCDLFLFLQAFRVSYKLLFSFPGSRVNPHTHKHTRLTRPVSLLTDADGPHPARRRRRAHRRPLHPQRDARDPRLDWRLPSTKRKTLHDS